MVNPRHRRPNATSGANADQVLLGSGGAWAVIGLIVVALIGVGRCSSTDTGAAGNTEMADMNVSQEALGSAIATQAPPPVEPLSKASVRRGEAHMKLASGEGLAGEMIYSQNCYDALSRHFTWSKLDICGAFDGDAVQALGDGDTTGFDKEAAWFESETAAARYLKAATSAGEDADGADIRLSDVQARVARSRPHDPTQAEGAIIDDEDGAETTPERAPLELNIGASSTNASASAPS